jgi:hypothetical protein
MTNRQKISEVLLRFRIDGSGLREVEQANAKLIAGLNNIGEGTRELSASAKKAQIELVNLASAGKIDATGFTRAAEEIQLADARLQGLNRELEETKLRLDVLESGEAFDALTLKARLLENEINSVNESLNRAGQGRPTTVGGLEAAGNASTALGGFASAASVISPEASNFLRAGGDIAGAVEQLKQLPSVINTVAPAFASVGAAAAAAAAPLGATAASIIGMTVAAAPFVAVAAAVALAIKVVTDAFSAGRDAIASAIAAEDAALQQRLQNAQEARTLSSQELDARVQDNQVRREILQQELAMRQAQLQSIQDQYAALGASFDPLTRAALGEAGLQLEASIADLEAQLNETSAAIDNDTNVLRPEIEAREREAQVIRDAQTAFDAAVQAEIQRNQLIESGTTQSVQAHIRALEAERQAIDANIDTLQTLEQVNAARDRQSEIDAEIALLNSTLPLIDAREAETAAIDAQLAAIQSGIQAEVEFARLRREATVEQVAARQQAIEDEINAIEGVLPELEELAGTSQEAAQQLEEANARLAELRGESARLASEVEPAARARQVEEGERQVQEATRQSEDRIRDIRAAAQEQLIALEQRRTDSLKKAAEDAEKALKDLAKRTNKAQGDENKRYMENERKAAEKFHADLEKSDAQNKKNLLRASQDMLNSLLDAEEDNDVIAFIRAKRAGEQNLARMKEDTDAATQERIDQFLAERQEAAITHQERLQQIKDTAVEEAAAIQQRKDDAIAAAEEAYHRDRQAALDNLNEKVAAEEAALQQTIARINEKYNLENQAATQAANVIRNAFIQAAQAVSQAVANASRSNPNRTPGAGAQGGRDVVMQELEGRRATPTAFGGPTNRVRPGIAPPRSRGVPPARPGVRFAAEGGIAPRGRQVEVQMERGRNYDEAFLPLEPNILAKAFGGLLHGNGGFSPTIHMTGDIIIGDNSTLTASEVSEAIHTAVFSAPEGIYDARTGGS